MVFRSAVRVMVALAATAALAQSGQPGTTREAPILDRKTPTPGKGPAGPAQSKPAPLEGAALIRKQIDDIEGTISQMRAVLEKMSSKAAKSEPADPLTKANLDMWELTVGHLDKQLEQLRDDLAVREDLDARRAALYKQADANAAAQAQAFRAAKAAKLSEAAQEAAQKAREAVAPLATQSSEQASPAKGMPEQAPPAQPSPAPR